LRENSGGVWVDSLYLEGMGEGVSNSDEKFLKSYIYMALSELWSVYKEKMEIGVLNEFLKKKIEETRDDRLSWFCDRLDVFMNSYGKFFSGESAVRFDNPFVVINTSSIDPLYHPFLLSALMVAMEIHIKIYSDKNRMAGNFKWSLVFIDRFQELLGRVPEIEKITWFFYRGARMSGISLFYTMETNIGTPFAEEEQSYWIKWLFGYANWLFLQGIFPANTILLTTFSQEKKTHDA
jgi:hypothetical protein